jgi:peptidoglycan/LPS O-acetylase OafA/YrhL
MAAGWTGVDLFFVLSGFLVSSLLLKPIAENGDVSISRFLIRRGFRIYPAFYLLLAVSIVAVEGLTNRIPWPPVMTEAVFIQNYFPGIWQHTWSLAVEEHFYLLLAVLVGSLAGARRHSPSRALRSLPTIIVSVMVLCFLLRTLHYFHLPEQRSAIYRNTHLRIDSLFAGVLLSYAATFRTNEFFRIVSACRARIAIAGTVFILPAWIFPLTADGFAGAFLLTIGFTLLALGCAAWVAIAANASTRSGQEPGRIWKIIRFIGVYSYAIYLWHLPVKKLSPTIYHRLTGDIPGEATQYMLYFGGSLALAMLTSHLLEFPLLRWRDRLIPSNCPEIASGAARRKRMVVSDVRLSTQAHLGSVPHLWR